MMKLNNHPLPLPTMGRCLLDEVCLKLRNILESTSSTEIFCLSRIGAVTKEILIAYFGKVIINIAHILLDIYI